MIEFGNDTMRLSDEDRRYVPLSRERSATRVGKHTFDPTPLTNRGVIP